MKRNNKKGFTIVELVIVIAVIVVLAAVLIPTFASIIKKANESVDMQVVKQMNDALVADEIVNGKPATVVDAQKILVANGLDDFTPVDSQNVFYWVGSENRVILWQKDEGDDVTTGKVTYPKEYAKTYKDITTPSADWKDLNFAADETNYILINPPAEDGGDLGTALANAIKDAPDGAIIKLPENQKISWTSSQCYSFNSWLKGAGGTGKAVTIDLNGNTLNTTYYDLKVPVNGSVTFAKGSIKSTGIGSGYPTIGGEAGSHIVLRDMNLETDGEGIYPKGEASEIILENCNVTVTGNYGGVATNRAASSNIRIVVKNSTITNAKGYAMFINTSCDAYVYDSTLTGTRGVGVRAGSLEMVDSTVISTSTAPGAMAYDNFAPSNAGYATSWPTGNGQPYATLLIGDCDSNNSYDAPSIVVLKNTKLQSADESKVPTILMAAGHTNKVATLTYDETSTVGTIRLYGEVWNPTGVNVDVTITHAGTITVNGEAKTLN